jgi:hypothetical protein
VAQPEASIDPRALPVMMRWLVPGLSLPKSPVFKKPSCLPPMAHTRPYADGQQMSMAAGRYARERTESKTALVASGLDL